MAHGLNPVMRRGVASSSAGCRNEGGKGVGSRRIFAPHFKLQVLDSYRNDADCKGNQRATARKYGIHRRQIQKWLQVENTLRNTVKENKQKQEVVPPTTTTTPSMVITTTATTTTTTTTTTTIMTTAPSDDNDKRTSPSSSCNVLNQRVLDVTLSNGGRQRDGCRSASAAEAAALARRSPAVCPPYVGPPSPSMPLDFTSRHVGRPSGVAPIDLSIRRPAGPAPSPTSPPPPPFRRPPSPLPVDTSPEPQPNAWDLSTKRKWPADDEYDRPTTEYTPVRSSSKFDPIQPDTSPKPVKLFKPYLDDIKKSPPPTPPPPLTPLQPMDVCCPIICEPYFYNNNNNNNNNNTICEATGSYTLHELQPNHYYYNPPYPLVECDVNGAYCYEEIGYGHGLAPLKQRQSYSLDFKLSAIDCYYQDSICKGNQRAVANKYNVHRRQIQKWLKQAEELRLRNESMKQLHAVR